MQVTGSHALNCLSSFHDWSHWNLNFAGENHQNSAGRQCQPQGERAATGRWGSTNPRGCYPEPIFIISSFQSATSNGFSGVTASVHRNNQFKGSQSEFSPEPCGHGAFGGTAWLMAVCWPEGPRSQFRIQVDLQRIAPFKQEEQLETWELWEDVMSNVIYSMLEIWFRLFGGGRTTPLWRHKWFGQTLDANAFTCCSTAPWDFMSCLRPCVGHPLLS